MTRLGTARHPATSSPIPPPDPRPTTPLPAAPLATFLATLWRQAVNRWRRLPAWARPWQFWLVLALSAVLRLAAIGRSPFDSDDALLFLEAGRAARDHLLPGTGIYSSLLALNPPIYTYLLLPFAFHPLGMAVVTALANVVAVSGLSLFTARYFGPWAGLVAGLLFATATYDTWMSEFVWQQTIVIPLLLAALALAYEGAVKARRGWLLPHTIVLALAIEIYPLAAAFLPVTLLALVLSWRRVRLGDLALAALACEVLLLPTILFEIASGGYDLPVYAQWLASPKHTDRAGVTALIQSLSPQASDYLGPSTWYAGIAPGFAWLTPAIVALALAAAGWLALLVVFPPMPALLGALGQRHGAPLRALLTDPVWRARLLLLPFPLALLAATTRHATPVYVHYLFVITPLIYIAIGIFLTTFPARCGRWLDMALARLWARLARGRPAARTHGRIQRLAAPIALPAPFAPLGGGLAGFVGGALIAAQLAVTSVFIVALASGQASATSWGRIPSAAYARAMDSVSALAVRDHIPRVFILGDPADPYMALYWAERQNTLAGANGPQWTAYVGSDCSLAPAAHERALVLATASAGPAVLASLNAPGSRLLQTIPMARDAAFALYLQAPDATSAAPALATVNGELRLNGSDLAPGSGSSGQTLFTHWTVLAATPPGPAVAQYHFQVTFSAPGAARHDVWASCEPSAWTAGEGLTVAVAVPPEIAARPGWTARVLVTRDTHFWYRPRLGALVLETAKELVRGEVVLPLGTRIGPGLAAPTADQRATATITLPLAESSISSG